MNRQQYKNRERIRLYVSSSLEIILSLSLWTTIDKIEAKIKLKVLNQFKKMRGVVRFVINISDILNFAVGFFK